LKKIYFSSHKLPKQQSTNFWSQGILGVKNDATKEETFKLTNRTIFQITIATMKLQRVVINNITFFSGKPVKPKIGDKDVH
jgi:hypothetical protein